MNSAVDTNYDLKKNISAITFTLKFVISSK